MSGQIRNRAFLWTVVVALAGGGVLWATWTLGHTQDTGQPLDPNQPAGKMRPKPPDHNEVTLSPTRQAKGGIVVAPLNALSFQEKLTAYGMVSDPQSLADSRSSFAGAQAKQESAQAELAAAREEYTRVQALYQDNRSTSEKSVQKAQATWLSDQAQARAAEVALQSQTAILRQHWGSVIAQWVENNSAAFVRLLAQEDVLIQITVSVGTKLSSPPASVTIETPIGTTETATFISRSPRTDPRIQGFSFFYLAPAQTTGLLPGMNVVAYLATGREIPGIYVPASAVVWQRGRAWIYVQTSPDTFVRREVPTDTPVSDGWFVHAGLTAGQRCVVQGAQLLLSEEAHARAPKGKETEE